MKTNDDIILELSKIKQASHKIIKDYLHQFVDLVEKLNTIFTYSIQTLWLKEGLLPIIKQSMMYMQPKSMKKQSRPFLSLDTHYHFHENLNKIIHIEYQQHINNFKRCIQGSIGRILQMQIIVKVIFKESQLLQLQNWRKKLNVRCSIYNTIKDLTINQYRQAYVLNVREITKSTTSIIYDNYGQSFKMNRICIKVG